MNYFKNLFIPVLLMISINTFSQGLRTQGKIIVNSQGEEVILRGMGPGGWQIMEGYMMQSSGVAGSQHEIKEKLIDLMGEANTEIFFSQWRANHFTQRDVDSLAAWGFNSIRLPMHYNLFTLPIEDEPVPGQNTWLTTGFELIDDLLEWCAPHNIYVILDMHATPGGQGTGSEINDYDPSKPSLWESQENREKLVALWTRIAETYKDHEWIGGYDLINETHWDLPGGAALRQIYEDITEGIRSVDTNHILFIEGNWYANDFTGLTPPWDDNMVYSFHKYWSFTNENDLDWVLPLREQHNIPLWMGEAGENSNTWFTDAVTLFENNGIGWAWWTMRKIGDIDSPYAVDINPGYQKILDYWAGTGPQPTSQETFDGMMQLAENLLVDNSRFRKDVPDALIRQVETDETKPYANHSIPGVVYLSDFDLGKNNFAYYDVDAADYNLSTGNFQAWNSGWSYRNDGVDIERNEDVINSNGFHVGFVQKGEWINYTVQIAESAAYSVNCRIASDVNGGGFHLSLDGEDITSSKITNSTGGWVQFESYEITDILLEAGEHILTLHIDNEQAFNISSMEFVQTGATSSIPFVALNGKTHEDGKSIELVVNQSVSMETLTGSLGSFAIDVSGSDQAITELTMDERERTIILSMENSLIFTDVVTVSYTGNTVLSETDKTLEPFTDLMIRNELPFRFILPGLIQAEDFQYMEGLQTEETTDLGGGSNIGFTDPGDFADYLIYVENEGNYQFDFRLAALSKEGSIGLYLVDENSEETELLVLTTPITGGWQTWETVSADAILPAGTNTLRMKVLSSGFNLNWMIASESIVSGFDKFDSGKILVYPNPTHGILHIANSSYDQYAVMSMSGSNLLSNSLKNNSVVNLSEVPSGIYILQLIDSTNGKTTQQKILVLK